MLWSKGPSDIVGNSVVGSSIVLAIDGANMVDDVSVAWGGTKKLAGVSISRGSVNIPLSTDFSAGALLAQKFSSSSRPRSFSPGFILLFSLSVLSSLKSLKLVFTFG